MRKLLVIGAGGHARSVIDSALDSKRFDVIGVVSPSKSDWQSYRGAQWIGTDHDAIDLFRQGYHMAALGVGYVGDNSSVREKLYTKYKDIGFGFPTIIDPSSIISASAVIQEGVFVGKGAVVNANAQVERCSIINSKALVEHDCAIGEFSHVAVCAVLCGGVRIGRKVLVGANATVLQELRVANNAVVGAGGVVLADVPENTKALGLYKGKVQ